MSILHNILNTDPNDLTPGMRQYQEAKLANPDCIILLRMGDFYESFYEDAVTISRELEITLTARGKGEKKAPLAGVPYHALEPYLGKLVKKGYKVAIIEQLEDPKQAKGLVKRGLLRIVTPGTIIDSSMLSEKENNYITAIKSFGEQQALAVCDISTGEFWTSSYNSQQELLNEIIRISPQECLFPESLRINTDLIGLIQSQGCFLNSLDDYYFQEEHAREMLLTHFNLPSLQTFGLADLPLNIAVSGGLIHYLTTTQKNNLSQVISIQLKQNNNTMLLDSSTLRNLELVKNLHDGSRRGTLLAVLDYTVTAAGARLLRKWLQQPLLDAKKITERLQATAEIFNNVILREELRSLLSKTFDLERLIGRVNYGNANPRDLLALKISLQQIPQIKTALQSCSSQLMKELGQLELLPQLVDLMDKSIREDAPLTVREGGLIKPSFHNELAELQAITKNSKKYLAEIEQQEKNKTGISTLKISYNKIFGYFIEVTKKNIHLVPSHYLRKQTTANAERYITADLKAEEEKIMGAQEKIVELEFQLFQEIIKTTAAFTPKIQAIASQLAMLDVFCTFAKVALENNYSCPQLDDKGSIIITKGRHPVIEPLKQNFITNDIFINNGEMMIVTGPNMAGKSTVMRQTALIVLMAQMGCFVPAETCHLSLVDRIFTRVGAYDDLSTGQSTFMVEMLETAAILNNATNSSLIILDEIGRGTSTFDGVAIAWSIAEYLSSKIKAKAMFATHYHVLNQLAEKFPQIKNYNIAVKEVKGELIFLRKIVPGGTDQSYGIHVAQLAGLPLPVIERAREIQTILESEDQMVRKIKAKKLQQQTSLRQF